MKVAKWGNSLAVRLPRRLVEELDLKEGDDVEITPVRDGLVIAPDRRKEAIIARLRELSSPLPPGYRFDRDEANER